VILSPTISRLPDCVSSHSSFLVLWGRASFGVEGALVDELCLIRTNDPGGDDSPT
jgi:hypothetical protein